eukprot:Hpha_TRINITY_DN11954_c0_g1::TRINITY_DN11954_c0_g1_i2::g.20416::m.20416
MQEEVFHMIHQSGFAQVYPSDLGMIDFTSSVVARETARLQCVQPGWWHPENQCPSDSPRSPGNPAPSPLSAGSQGDCTDPSCDIAEFYKQALFVAIGMSPDDDVSMPSMWFSDYMPRTKAAALSMLSADFKAMINKPSLHQLTKPITGMYGATPTRSPSGTTQTPSGTTQPSSGTTQTPSSTTQPPTGTPAGSTPPPYSGGASLAGTFLTVVVSYCVVILYTL